MCTFEKTFIAASFLILVTLLSYTSNVLKENDTKRNVASIYCSLHNCK